MTENVPVSEYYDINLEVDIVDKATYANEREKTRIWHEWKLNS